MRRLFKAALLVAILLAFNFSVTANLSVRSAWAAPAEKVEPVLGNIAGTSRAGGLEYSDSNAIAGSVSRKNSTQWMIRVFNNSEDRYSTSFELEQFDKAGRRLGKKYYSYTLEAGRKKEELVNSSRTVDSMQLNLVKAKNLSSNNKKK